MSVSSADTITQHFLYFLAVGSFWNTVALLLSAVGVCFTFKISVCSTPPGYLMTFYCTVSQHIIIPVAWHNVARCTRLRRIFPSFFCNKRAVDGIFIAVTTLRTWASSLCVSRLGANVASGINGGCKIEAGGTVSCCNGCWYGCFIPQISPISVWWQHDLCCCGYTTAEPFITVTREICPSAAVHRQSDCEGTVMYHHSGLQLFCRCDVALSNSNK
jgi:hypothetical protein